MSVGIHRSRRIGMVGALMSVIGGLMGAVPPPIPGPQPGPKDSPKKRGNHPDARQHKIRAREWSHWGEAFRAWRRKWAPAGGGAREVARRLRQIEAGTLAATHRRAARELAYRTVTCNPRRPGKNTAARAAAVRVEEISE